jgi:hypothetical protein
MPVGGRGGWSLGASACYGETLIIICAFENVILYLSLIFAFTGTTNQKIANPYHKPVIPNGGNTRGQFHKRSICSFYVRKLHEQLFSAYNLGLYFTGARLLAQKLGIEC